MRSRVIAPVNSPAINRPRPESDRRDHQIGVTELSGVHWLFNFDVRRWVGRKNRRHASAFLFLDLDFGSPYLDYLRRARP